MCRNAIVSASETSAIYPLITGHFLNFLVVGIPLPVLPSFVHNTLGYSNAMAGFVIGIHFLTTVLFRGMGGRLCDSWGGKPTMMTGAVVCAASGLPYLLVALTPVPQALILPCLIVGRIFLGIGHSMVGTSTLTWGFGLLGPQRMGRVISWTGISMYASIACGAPIGILLHEMGGIAAIGTVTCLLPICAVLLLSQQAKTPVVKKTQQSSAGGATLFWHVLRPGICLAMHGAGNASISTFVALYFASRGWEHVGTALTIFGVSFILARILCGDMPDKKGGIHLTLIFFAIEGVGLTLLGAAPFLAVAFMGIALTGFGCSLIYPSIGVGMLRVVPLELRGRSVAWFTAFQDISLGLTGPLMGLLVPQFGYSSIFYAAAGCTVLGILLTVFSRERK